MKAILAALLILTISIVSGCATSNVTAGRDFSSANVAKIVKGKTTVDEMTQMFGQPFTKVVLSQTEEKWMYFYNQTASTAQNYVVSMSVKTASHQKTLDVLITNGVVSNYTFTEGENPSVVNVN